MIHCVLFILENAFLSCSTALSSDEVFRHRGFAGNTMFWRMSVVLFALPRRISYGTLVCFTLNDIGALLLADSLHNTSTQYRVYFTVSLWSILGIYLLEFTVHRFRMLYDVQENLIQERSLQQKLLEMLCDGSIKVVGNQTLF